MKFVYLAILVALLAGGFFFWETEVASDHNDMMDDANISEDVIEDMEEHMDEVMDDDSAFEAMEEHMDDVFNTENDTNEVSFDVVGTNFSFDRETITVTEGDTVTINFSSAGGFHDWVVDEFDAASARVNDGGKTFVTFVADKAGTYEYYCSVGNHRAQGMIGTLIVESK